jgi:uncharacterized protein (TIGR03435 family)
MLNPNLPKKVGFLLAGIPAVAIPVILGITNAPELRAQAEAVPKFEVASVRPSPPLHLPITTGFRAGIFLDGDRVEIRYLSLRDLIILAYRIKPYQLAGTADWMTTEVFDILATIPHGVSTVKAPCGDVRPCRVSATKAPEMLQSLLAERFGLKIRRESREMPVYTLTVDRGGPRFPEVPPEDPEAELEFLKPSEGGLVASLGGAPARIGGPGGRSAGSRLLDDRGRPTVESFHIETAKATMGNLSDGLTSMADRPVVDRTGLAGTYAIGFDAPSRNVTRLFQGPMPGKLPSAAPPPGDPEGDSIFQSVQPLGLRLERDKALIETIVIEHIEKTPTEN